MTKIRLHLPGIPNTICKDEYNYCAFTGKTQRFSKMMKSVGYEVYYYGIESSESYADKQIDLLNLIEFDELTLKSYKQLFPNLNEEELKYRLSNPIHFIGQLSNLTTILYKEFNKRFREKLIENYRSVTTDIVCLPYGPAHLDAVTGLNYVFVESGIGYNNAYENFRIYESYAIMHYDYSRCQKQHENYWFVCPNYYNIDDWQYNDKPDKKIGFLGRVCDSKGILIIFEIAKKFPDIEFVICGQGDFSNYLDIYKDVKNVVYKEPIHGKERGEYLSNLSALLVPSTYLEPFCGVSAEAQLCGTPVITTDYGAFVENVEQFKTGMRCHTLSDFCHGIQMAIDGKFDRKYIRERAVNLFDMYKIAKQYDYIFKSINNIYNGTNGWYSNNNCIYLLEPEEHAKEEKEEKE